MLLGLIVRLFALHCFLIELKRVAKKKVLLYLLKYLSNQISLSLSLSLCLSLSVLYYNLKKKQDLETRFSPRFLNENRRRNDSSRLHSIILKMENFAVNRRFVVEFYTSV